MGPGARAPYTGCLYDAPLERGFARTSLTLTASCDFIERQIVDLFFAFVYNALGVPIAAGAFYPSTGLLLSPIIASAAMTLSSVSVIANALLLRRIQL